MDDVLIINIALLFVGALVSFMLCLAGYDPGAIGPEIDSPLFDAPVPPTI